MPKREKNKRGAPAAARGLSFTGKRAPVKESILLDYLGTGREAARTAGEIAAALGVSKRRVSLEVQRARRDGAPICAATTDPKGYFLARDRGELKAYSGRLDRRLSWIAATADAVRETVGSMPEE